MITINVKTKSKIAVKKKSPNKLYGLTHGEVYIMLGCCEEYPRSFIGAALAAPMLGDEKTILLSGISRFVCNHRGGTT